MFTSISLIVANYVWNSCILTNKGIFENFVGS